MTNYTGDPNATQAPAPEPGPQAQIVLSVPQDTVDDLNVSSVLQIFKAVADFINWLMDKFARSAQWAQPIERWRNARLQPGFIVDHMGFPAGAMMQWQENWRGSEAQTGTGSTVFVNTVHPFAVNVLSAGLGLILINPPDKVSTPNNPTRNLRMTLGTGGTDAISAIGEPHVLFGAGQCIVMEWTLRTDTGVNQFTGTWGIGGGSGFDTPSAGFVGMVIQKHDGDANLWFGVGDGTAVSALVDTGVSFATTTRFKLKLEYVSADVADDGVEACRVYVNGVLKATILTNMPSAAANPLGGVILSMKRTTGSTARTIDVGPIRVSTNY